jgi:hypothetical protein
MEEKRRKKQHASEYLHVLEKNKKNRDLTNTKMEA